MIGIFSIIGVISISMVTNLVILTIDMDSAIDFFINKIVPVLLPLIPLMIVIFTSTLLMMVILFRSNQNQYQNQNQNEIIHQRPSYEEMNRCIIDHQQDIYFSPAQKDDAYFDKDLYETEPCKPVLIEGYTPDEIFPRFTDIFWYILENSKSLRTCKMLYYRLICALTYPLQTELVTVDWDLRDILMKRAAEYANGKYIMEKETTFLKLFCIIFFSGNRYITGTSEILCWKIAFDHVPNANVDNLFDWWWVYQSKEYPTIIKKEERAYVKGLVISSNFHNIENDEETFDKYEDYLELLFGLRFLFEKLEWV